MAASIKMLPFSYKLSVTAAAAMLAGCGGSQPPIGAPGAQGEAHFASTESNVLVDGTMDRFGHVFWSVTLRGPRSGEVWPELKFNIQEDQTLLWNVAAKIGDMFEALGIEEYS
jgi:hypothetical protein